MTDTQGRQTNLTYNASGYLSQITDASSPARTWKYNYTGSDLTSYVDPNGKTTSYTYGDSANDLTKVVTPGGHATVISYQNPSAGDLRVKQIIRQTGTDGSGNPTGPTWNFSYYGPDTGNCPQDTKNPNLGKTVVTDPEGRVTTYCYDYMDRTTKVWTGTTPATPLSVSDSSYSPNSDPTKVDAGDPNATGGSQQVTTSYDYNDNGATSFDPSATYTMKKQTSPTGGFFSVPSYDASFPYQPHTATNENGSTYSYTYDGTGNLSQVTDSSVNNNAQLFWNLSPAPNSCGRSTNTGPAGTLRCAQDGNGKITMYGYDTAGNLTSITPPVQTGQPLIGATAIQVDPATSRVTKITDGMSRSRSFTYDALDRVKTITFGDGKVITYTYDDDGNLTSTNDSADGTTNSSFSYDALNRLTSETLAHNRTTSYSYDQSSNLTLVDDGPGTTAQVSYTYDGANRVQHVIDPGGNCGTTPSGCTTYAYNTRNDPTSTTLPNHVQITRTFDKSDHVTEIKAVDGSGTTLEDLIYGYDRDSTTNGFCSTDTSAVSTALIGTQLRHKVTDAKANQTTVYCYDGEDRLVHAHTTSGASTVSDYAYKLDGAGNRTEQDVTSGGTTTNTFYAYSVTNNLCWLYATATKPANGCTPTPNGGTTYGFDAAGNQTTGGLSYNARNQLTAIGTTSLSYNGPDNQKLTGDGSNVITPDLLGTGVEDFGQTATYFTRDASGALVTDRDASGSKYYYLADALGSVVALTNSAGSIVKSYSYDPYGKLTSSSTGPNQPYGFAGGYMPAGGPGNGGSLYHFGRRFYDPTVGHWTQSDLLEAPSSLREGNHYLYAGDDPVNMTDPSGLFFVDISIDAVLPEGVSAGVAFGGGGIGIHPHVGYGVGAQVGAHVRVGKGKYQPYAGITAEGCAVVVCKSGTVGFQGGQSDISTSSSTTYGLEIGGSVQYGVGG